MNEFLSYPDCTSCSLHESATNPGLPTRALYDNAIRLKQRAILFVGQSPGHHEDRKGISFTGYTGQLLRKLVEASRLSRFCDIFLANACRCKPPQAADLTQSQIRACRGYLQLDIATLYDMGYEEVIVFSLGAKACYATLNLSSLAEGFKKQGTQSQFLLNAAKFATDGNVGPRVFLTYHPAMVHPSRSPAKIKAMEVHFSLVLRYLKGEFVPNNLKVHPEVGVRVPE
ncbi:MAG: uracil-DNA glycosylase family protein, partial [Planctomycetota bacterium]